MYEGTFGTSKHNNRLFSIFLTYNRKFRNKLYNMYVSDQLELDFVKPIRIFSTILIQIIIIIIIN